MPRQSKRPRPLPRRGDSPQGLPRAWLFATVTVAAVAAAAKLAIALTTYGTNDVLYWEAFLARLKQAGGLGLYHQIGIFNHPPFMVHALRVMDAAAALSGLSFRFWLRVPAILADFVNVLLVVKLLEPWIGRTIPPIGFVLLAAAPASLMIAGFHGNTDPFMIFFVLLSLYLIVEKYPLVAGGLGFRYEP